MNKTNTINAAFAFLLIFCAKFSHAADGTIYFTGTISADACTVNAVADTASTSATVDFGSVNSSTLSAAGSTTVRTPFNIELTDCAVASAPEITFSGTAVTTAGYTELFATDVDGVGIRIEDAGSTGAYYTSGVSSSNTGLSQLDSSSVTSATGNFNAYLVSYDDETKTGDIDTSVTFIINYSDS